MKDICLLVLLGLLPAVLCAPVVHKKPEPPAPSEQPSDDDLASQLEYEKYLKEVVDILEQDEGFRKKLDDANVTEIKMNLEYRNYLMEVIHVLGEDKEFVKKLEGFDKKDTKVKSGEIARHLDFVHHNIRTKLDEIKRREVERLREVARMRMRQQNGKENFHSILFHGGVGRVFNDPNHLDHNNPHTFEVEDLAKLIKQATSDLEVADKQRRGEFKKYEMEKEHLRKEKLKEMDEEHRKKAEHEYEEQKKKHRDHPKLHHPGSRDQLEEVWEEEDHMDKDSFDPHSFFMMHDTNSDGYLELDEVEALFNSELDKIYDPNATEDDMNERYEEMSRMREHVMNEIDKDGDGLISWEEFHDSTKKDDFKKDEGWKTIDEEQQYTDEELAEFEREYEEEMRRQGHMPPNLDHQGQPIGVNHMGQQPPHPGQFQQPPQGHPQFQQPPPGHHEQLQYQQQGHPQQGVPQGHPQGIPQGHPQGYPQGVPQGYPQGHPQAVPQGHHQQGAPQGHQQGVPQGVPQHAREGIPVGSPQQVRQGHPQQLAHNRNEELAAHHVQQQAQQMQQTHDAQQQQQVHQQQQAHVQQQAQQQQQQVHHQQQEHVQQQAQQQQQHQQQEVHHQQQQDHQQQQGTHDQAQQQQQQQHPQGSQQQGQPQHHQ